jgi:hypothetical protein
VESGFNLFPIPSFGANWMLSDASSFGFALYDPGKRDGFQYRGPRVVEQHFTFGLSKLFGDGRELSFSVMRALTDNVSGPNTLEALGAQLVELSMNQWDIDISFSFGF